MPDSLLGLRLVRQMLEDPRIRMVPRAVDTAWAWEGFIERRVCGFNPLEGAVFYGAESPLQRWLEDPTASPRILNRSDRLVQEVWTAVHDYIHCWAYAKVHDLRPELGFGTGRLCAETLDEMLFCHLLTEAAAVAGLDYWFLATFDVNSVCPIGTAHQRFAVAYREQHLSEYRRYNPDLEVQTPAFFETLVRFYCTGRWRGFSNEDLALSPLLDGWLGKEISYCRIQREIGRRWFAHLGGFALPGEGAALGAPVDCERAERVELTRELGHALWAKVKYGDDPPTERIFDSKQAWRSPPGPLDYRFDNLCARSGGDVCAAAGASRSYYWYQYLSTFSFSRVDPTLKPALKAVTLGRLDVRAVRPLLERQSKVSATPYEPPNILLLN